MDQKRKVGFVTKLLSNRMYLNEVSVEGKTSNKFNFKIGWYDLYAAQIIRNGNCITLLSNSFVLDKMTFWNTNYFEDLTRYVFWTFNKSFLATLTDAIETLSPITLQRCAELLRDNFTPYDDKLEENADEELYWCLVKNGWLKKDSKFVKMYALDEENRTSLLQALENNIASFNGEKKNTGVIIESGSAEIKPAPFTDMLRPLDNDSGEPLEFIRVALQKAGFEADLLSKIPKLPNGKNPYGLNGTIAAMIDFFYQHNYFKKEYLLEDIFKAYAAYSGNSIAKLKTFLSQFREDKTYIKYFSKLNELKIKKLK
jgi:hypothetical protein